MVFFASSAVFLSVLCGQKLLTAEYAENPAEYAEEILPRVWAEMPAPPAPGDERIGKEAPAGMFPPASVPLSKCRLDQGSCLRKDAIGN
jgi:hypothetical protein